MKELYHLSHSASPSHLGIYPREIKTHFYKKTWTKISQQFKKESSKL
jgi:hypothetical protein